ncbi:MAG TPA: PQQ-dependent sugar dehydrogenase [Gammaproteobacteria bacterium]|nr:PQQ-dependent sugar dehydrogenase [Gammaproteobacteria bacterium]
MNRRLAPRTAAAALGCLSLAPVRAQPPAAPAPRLPTRDAPLLLDAGAQKIRVVLVADGLVGPWDIAFLPDGNLLVTESNGALRLVEKGVVKPEPVWKAAATGNDVLHGLVIHPDFARNHFVYVSYFKDGGDKGQTTAVSRGRIEGGKLKDVKEIFVADAWENARMAIAGRMLFGPDKTLYLTVGDRDRLCCGPKDDASIRMRAQSLTDHVGKVLRLTDDGGIPKDNPFVGRADARGEIFTYGHRNGYGLAFHPETGELWELEIGPMGGDEINVLKPGANYGWPLVSMGRNYSGTLVSDHPFERPGMENPRVFWVPSISPSGLAFYAGDKFPAWKGSLFVGALSGLQVQRIAFNQPGQAERRESLLTEMHVRFRDVEQGPDGYLYFTTEVRYGSGKPDGTIIRLEPAP